LTQNNHRKDEAKMNMSLDPSPILQTAFGFWQSKVLLTAVEMGLFTKLANNRLTALLLLSEVLVRKDSRQLWRSDH
jgi:hypothetical protein